MRELFLDEGLEDRVLDDLKQLWEAKMMQSKEMEDFRRNNINPCNFVLQLPVNYSQTDEELTASVMIPTGQNVHSFPAKNNPETLATFSLPAGLAYPVQIPAGVTLQTASGQLYKVNVPVVVTQAPAGHQPLTQPTQQVTEWREAPAPPLAVVPPSMIPSQEMEPRSVASVTATHLPPSQQGAPLQQTPALVSEGSQPQQSQPGDPEVTVENSEPSSQPANPSMASCSSSQLLDFHIDTEEALTQAQTLQATEMEEILKEVIKEESDDVVIASDITPPQTDNQSEAVVKLDLDYNYSELSEIVQLDGPADNSDIEKEEEVPLEENDFLGIINAEAIKALQEVDESSDGNSISSSSDSDGADELANVVEEDPLNSGDDVIEQDIPDLFDTDNVIVCQYDKIHRSKNRWKFHLKDGVMCYGGRDYVFSKAIGEAEW
ncbi:TFIIA-alpha and beta-like factor isoform X2 [Myripristis murdjan]|nr:TFIIA-alpha and beta-like factor isoform X2 [Myripristis murdjan]XP_029925935.1 TFIIA-alpha and beta-like factor isoform X2 [Myripristis murdjan]